MTQTYLTYGVTNSYNDNFIDDIIEMLSICEIVKKRKGKKNIEYINVPNAFDIETTSFHYHNEKSSLMYIWQAGFNGNVIYGRTWKEFTEMIDRISRELDLCDMKRLVIYVHNLSFEFQFIRKLFKWKQVFALDSRTPIYALTENGIEFRCSYLLSGYSLAKLGDNLVKYKVSKMVGDLDYKLLRHHKTPLTEKELGYCINDVRVVMSYIQEKIEHDNGIQNIPLTKTGYVRQYTRKKCLRGVRAQEYRHLMSTLTIEPDEYKMLKRAFQGGFTHANYRNACKVFNNVTSADFASSYPAVMVAEKFPMSKGFIVKPTNMKHFRELCKRYCLIFDIEFTELAPKLDYDHPLSASKCSTLTNPVVDNGRVQFAELAITTITDIDFTVLEKFYTWEKIRIGKCVAYEKAYLPTPLVESILVLYKDKTTLKHVAGKEVEYLLSKEQINACYGMVVTDIVRDLITYDEDWKESKADLHKEIDKYNNDHNRFLFYPWGVFVTSYARRNLFTGIAELKQDYIYSDTDSVKFINADNHIKYFEKYNNNLCYKMKLALEHHNLSYDMIHPKTVEGIECYLGVWDMNDGFYTRFKTLGAKRYMIEEDNKINITVSGINKKLAVPYLLQTYTDPFNAFDNGLKFPKNYINNKGIECSATGKLTHTYIDEIQKGVICDYLGNEEEYITLSGIHMENADYELSLSEIYINFIKGVTKQ